MSVESAGADRGQAGSKDAPEPLRPLPVSQRQEKELAAIASFGKDALTSVLEHLEKLSSSPLTLRDLRLGISSVIGSDKADILTAQLVNLSFVSRKRKASGAAIVDALTRGLRSSAWTTEQHDAWLGVKEVFTNLVSSPILRMIVKTTELSLDYTNYYDNARIIVDMRPLFDEERDTILAGVLSAVLRLQYISDSETVSLTALMDKEDIENLKDACEKALKKIEVVRGRMEVWGLRSIGPGEKPS